MEKEQKPYVLVSAKHKDIYTPAEVYNNPDAGGEWATLAKRAAERFSPEQIERMRKGVSDHTVAKEVGMSTPQIGRYRRALGINRERQGRPHSLDHSEVYEMWLEGRKDREIAEALGCTRQYISTVRSKNGWVGRKIATKCKAPGCDKDYGPKSGKVGAHGYCKPCYSAGWGRKPYRELKEMYIDLKQRYRDLEREYIDLELEYDFLKHRTHVTTKRRE